MAEAGSEAEAGVGLLQTLGVVRMAYRCHLLLRWMAKGRLAGSTLMIGLIGGAVAMVCVARGGMAQAGSRRSARYTFYFSRDIHHLLMHS